VRRRATATSTCDPCDQASAFPRLECSYGLSPPPACVLVALLRETLDVGPMPAARLPAPPGELACRCRRGPACRAVCRVRVCVPARVDRSPHPVCQMCESLVEIFSGGLWREARCVRILLLHRVLLVVLVFA